MVPFLAAMAGRAAGAAVGAEAGAARVAATGGRLAAAQSEGASPETLKRLKKHSDEAISSQNKLSESYKNVGQNAGIAASLLQGLGSKISGALVGTLTTAATALKAFADPIAELVQLANPAVVEQFNWAFKDSLAVIGRALLPIMQSLTRAMRIVGDNFARMEPIILSVSKFVGQLIDDIFKDLNDLWSKSGPLVEFLADAFKAMADMAAMAVKVLISLANAFVTITTTVMRMLGISGSKVKKDGSAMGAAVRNVGIGQSAEDISRSAQAKAFSLALAQPEEKPPEVQTVDFLKSIFDFLGENLKIEKIKKAIYDALPNRKDIPGGETLESFQKSSPLGSFLQSLLTR